MIHPRGQQRIGTISLLLITFVINGRGIAFRPTGCEQRKKCSFLTASGRGGEGTRSPALIAHRCFQRQFTHRRYLNRDKMDNRTINDNYAEIARKLIEEEPSLEYIRDSQATIVYLSSEHEKKEGGKLVYGQCEKVSAKYKWAIPCDFTITVFEPNVERFTDEQIKILLHHELLHVGIRMDGNEEEYYVVPHDVEDFKEILERYGIGWSNET